MFSSSRSTGLKRSNIWARGFSVIELIIVVAILGILFTITAGLLRSDRTSVTQAAQGLSAQISRARLEAIRRNTFAGICFSQTGSGSYSLRTADSAADVCPDGTLIQTVTLGTGDWAAVRFGTPTLPDGFDGVVFNSRGMVSGTVSGTLVIQNTAQNFSKNVSINAQGRASIQ